MKKQLLIALAMLVCALPSFTRADTYYFKGGANPLQSAGSWNTARDGSGTDAADFTTAGNTFVIQNAQTPTLGSAWTITGAGSGLLIETGGAMDPSTFNPTLTLSMQSGANYNVTAASASYSNLTIGTANPASTFTISGMGKTLLDKPYGNLTWKVNNNQSAAGNVNTSGTLTIDSLSQLRVSTGTIAQTWNIGGDILVKTSSQLNLNPNVLNSVVNVSGSFTSTGTLNKSGAGGATLAFVGSAPATVTWGTVTSANLTANVTFNVANTKSLTFIDSLNEGAATFTNNGILNLGNNVLSGTNGKFTLSSGATIITSNATGLDGAITVTGAKTFDSAANYEFRGAATGTTLPATVNDLTINRSSGDVDLQGAGSVQAVSGALKVTSGNLNANGTRTQVQVGGSGDAVVMGGGGQINSNATVVMTGTGDVAFDATNNGTATIAGNVDLGGAMRNFNVSNGTANVDMEVSGQLTNGVISKSGAGKLRISAGQGFNNLTPIDINGGTLQADNPTGSATGAAAVTINNGGTLAGSGAVAGNVTVNNGGNVSPGNSIDSLDLGANLSFISGGSFVAEIDSSAALSAAADLLNIGGNLSIASGALLNLSDIAGTSTLLANGTKLTLMSYAGTWDTGTFDLVPDDSLVTVGANTFLFNYNDTTPGVNFPSDTPAMVSYVTLTAVPEASVVVFGTALCAAVFGLRYAKRKRLPKPPTAS